VGEVVDYRSLRWSKLLLNMLGAATSAILDMDMAELAANPDLFRLEQLAIREAGRVMDARKIRTVSLPGYPVPLLRLAMRWPRLLAQRAVARRLAGARRGRSPTARADIERGRSEIPFLNGAVAAAAGRLGLRAPVNAALTELVEELLIHPELRAQFRGRPERLLEYMRGRGVRV
jgi:2-dehydropantoate 2-reductase